MERQFALGNGILREAAATIVRVEEGRETSDLWDALGGACSAEEVLCVVQRCVDVGVVLYCAFVVCACDSTLLGKSAYVSCSSRLETRLFQCSIGSGMFTVRIWHHFDRP